MTASGGVMMQIFGASYGPGVVTAKVASLYAGGERRFVAENSVFGDPKPGLDKCLTIVYAFNGDNHTSTCLEHG